MRLPDSGKALLRSQRGPGAGLAFTTCPTCRITKMEPHVFRVLLMRRLHLPLPWTLHSCRCGLPLDSRGHHRAACARDGVLGRRGALESVAARICREAGGRVSTNVMVRDQDLVQFAGDARRLEVADGLPPQHERRSIPMCTSQRKFARQGEKIKSKIFKEKDLPSK